MQRPLPLPTYMHLHICQTPPPGAPSPSDRRCRWRGGPLGRRRDTPVNVGTACLGDARCQVRWSSPIRCTACLPAASLLQVPSSLPSSSSVTTKHMHFPSSSGCLTRQLRTNLPRIFIPQPQSRVKCALSDTPLLLHRPCSQNWASLLPLAHLMIAGAVFPPPKELNADLDFEIVLKGRGIWWP